jgi:hypothetical protein
MTICGAYLFRSTRAFLSFQIFEEVRRVKEAIDFRLGVELAMMSHHSLRDFVGHCWKSMK